MWPGVLDGADGTSDKVFGHADNGMLAAIMPAIVVGVFLALATQMLRTDGRAKLVLDSVVRGRSRRVCGADRRLDRRGEVIR